MAEAAVMRGDELGPLHGVPIAIKYLVPTTGLRTVMGSKAFEHHVPDADGLVVRRAEAAGAIVLGKTNVPEMGFKGATVSHLSVQLNRPSGGLDALRVHPGWAAGRDAVGRAAL